MTINHAICILQTIDVLSKNITVETAESQQKGEKTES